MLRTTWAYSLKRDDLVNYLQQFKQHSTGSVEELRKQFAKFLAADHDEDQLQELLQLQARHDSSNKASSSPGQRLQVPTEATFNPLTPVKIENPAPGMSHNASKRSFVMLVEVIKKWDLKYDGGRNPLTFIERVEEHAELYDVNLNGLPKVMSEFFTEKASIWFRNNNRHWKEWTHFKNDFYKFFLPPLEKLEDEIRKRTQRPRESFKDYVLVMQDLMRHISLPEDQKLERIFRNAQPDYQWYIRRKDFSTLNDLIQMADDLEAIPKTSHPQRGEHNRMVFENRANKRNSQLQQNKNLQNKTQLVWENEKLKAVLLIEKQLLTAILDTVATRSFITPEQVNRLYSEPASTTVNISVLLADGSPKIITDAIQLKVTFGTTTAMCQFLVMTGASEDIVLGLDFLKALDTTISCAGLVVNSCDTNSNRNKDEGESRDAQVSHTVYTPKIYSVTDGRDEKRSTPNCQEEMKRFLEEELPKVQNVTGLSNIATHKIVMKDDRPIKIRYSQRNPAMQAIIDAEVNKLISQECIEPSCSPYSFPITLVKKKDGSWRTCMDFRQLNSRSVPDAYPLSKSEAILNRLRNAKFISSLDLKNGYWQIPMDRASKQYTAFAVPGRGLYQWRVMPFGLHSASATFQRALDTVIGADMEPFAFWFQEVEKYGSVGLIPNPFGEKEDNVTTKVAALVFATIKRISFIYFYKIIIL